MRASGDANLNTICRTSRGDRQDHYPLGTTTQVKPTTRLQTKKVRRLIVVFDLSASSRAGFYASLVAKKQKGRAPRRLGACPCRAFVCGIGGGRKKERLPRVHNRKLD